MARRRYQRGTLLLRGKRQKVWVGRWLDDVVEDGLIRRVHRSEVLGTQRDYPTRKLALRALEERLAVINSPTYRARPTATFKQFAARWEATVLPQHKPSTQSSSRSLLRRHLTPFFGSQALREIQPETVQRFVASLKAVRPKTVRNVIALLRVMWNSARAWRYVAHDAFEEVRLPARIHTQPFFFTAEEVGKIVVTAPEPYSMFYGLIAETGLRAGEACGLRVEDVDLDAGTVRVCQSIWRGHVHDPKTRNAVRVVDISPQLVAKLYALLETWRPNAARLLFATRNGTPWDANLVVKRKLHPILDALKIRRCGLHAFRHANASLMDRCGTPLKVRQQRLGHSDPRLTLGVYTHIVSEDAQRTAKQLGKLIWGKELEIRCLSLPKLANAPAVANKQSRWIH